MKIAILACTDFSIVGGGERFTYDIARALDATIISFGREKDLDRTHECEGIKFKFLNNKLPKEPFKNLYGKWFFSHLKLDEEFDFYIAMDDMTMHFVKNKPHLYLMFTPNRAMYDMNTHVIHSKKHIFKLIYLIGLEVFRRYDQYYVNKHVKNIVGISHTVRNRVYKAYLRHADVLYPSVDVCKYKYCPHQNYWLSVNRVDKWKRIELQVETFKQLSDMTLYVVGQVYPEYEDFVANAPDNVKFMGVVPEEHLIDLYSKCTGFLTTAIDEDFGLTPVEAMASGKPVVAVMEGGYMETVVDGHTGYFASPDAWEIANTIRVVSEKPEMFKDACIERAWLFDYSVMKYRIQVIVKKALKIH